MDNIQHVEVLTWPRAAAARRRRRCSDVLRVSYYLLLVSWRLGVPFEISLLGNYVSARFFTSNGQLSLRPLRGIALRVIMMLCVVSPCLSPSYHANYAPGPELLPHSESFCSSYHRIRIRKINLHSWLDRQYQ